MFAASSGALSGVSAAVIKGYQTQDLGEALKAGAIAGSEDFKWGVITGTLTGGAAEYSALKGVTTSGLK